MKKMLFLLSLSLFSLLIAKAQDKLAFTKGSSCINLGVGLGNPYWGSGVSGGINPIGSYEYGFTDNISAGANLGYSSVSESFTYPDYDPNTGQIIEKTGKIKETGVLIGARGSYHFATSEKFDPYVGLALGYVIVSVSDNISGGPGGKASGVAYGAHIGARYFISKGFGFHAELGYMSLSFLTAGISFKF